MKYIGMPMGMWALFGKSFERNLITEFGLDGETAKMTAAKAKPRYKEIIAGLPEFEKEDRFKMNIRRPNTSSKYRRHHSTLLRFVYSVQLFF